MEKPHITLQKLTVKLSEVLEMLMRTSGRREKVCHHLSSLVYSANLREYEGIMHCGCSHSNPHIPSLQESQQPGLTCKQANSGIKDTTATLDCISAVTLSLWTTFS